MSGEVIAADSRYDGDIGDIGDMTAPSAPTGKLSKLLGRAGWNLADQALSALTNIALMFLVARIVHDADRFGAFMAAMLVFSLSISVERALAGQVLGVRHSHLTWQEMRPVARDSLGTVATLGIAVGVVCIVVGLVIGGVVGPPLIALGVVLPWVLLQDACRYIFFTLSTPKYAAINDAIWTVVQFSAVGVLAVAGMANVWSLILAWGGAAAIGVLVALAQLRVVPRLSASVGWCREHGDLMGYMLPETLLTSGGLQGTTMITGKIVGVAGVGSIGGSQRLLGPLNMVSSAVMSFAMPELSRRKDIAVRKKWAAALLISGVWVLGSLAYLGILLLLPDSVGELMFGATSSHGVRSVWHGVRSVLLPAGLFSAAAGACLGPSMIVISMGKASKSFRVTLMEFPLVLTLMPLGAVLGGAPGATWGQFVAQVVQVPFWFLTLRSVLRAEAAGDATPNNGMDCGPRHRT